MLADFPADRLTETIPFFHDTPRRYGTFRAAVAEDAAGRLFAALGGEEPRFLGQIMPSPAVLQEKVLVFAGKGSGQAPEGLSWMPLSQGLEGDDLCTAAALALWALGEE